MDARTEQNMEIIVKLAPVDGFEVVARLASIGKRLPSYL